MKQYTHIDGILEWLSTSLFWGMITTSVIIISVTTVAAFLAINIPLEGTIPLEIIWKTSLSLGFIGTLVSLRFPLVDIGFWGIIRLFERANRKNLLENGRYVVVFWLMSIRQQAKVKDRLNVTSSENFTRDGVKFEVIITTSIEIRDPVVVNEFEFATKKKVEGQIEEMLQRKSRDALDELTSRRIIISNNNKDPFKAKFLEKMREHNTDELEETDTESGIFRLKAFGVDIGPGVERCKPQMKDDEDAVAAPFREARKARAEQAGTQVRIKILQKVTEHIKNDETLGELDAKDQQRLVTLFLNLYKGEQITTLRLEGEEVLLKAATHLLERFGRPK